jgi:hypothetical protein
MDGHQYSCIKRNVFFQFAFMFCLHWKLVFSKGLYMFFWHWNGCVGGLCQSLGTCEMWDNQFQQDWHVCWVYKVKDFCINQQFQIAILTWTKNMTWSKVWIKKNQIWTTLVTKSVFIYPPGPTGCKEGNLW